MPRLKRLYEDLHTAIVNLLPPGHPVLITLSSPLSPTSAPLRSAVTHLREVLAALRERCAPSRDLAIDTLLAKLEDPVPSGLPQLIIDTIRDTLALAEQMKKDLSQFVLGSMGEKQLHKWIVANAIVGEREFVHKLWGEGKTRELWNQWIAELEPSAVTTTRTPSVHQRWRIRLMQTIGAFVPIFCEIQLQTDQGVQPVDATSTQLPSEPVAHVPPPLFFVAPSLLMIQNYMQALVVTASLRSLIRLPTTSPAYSFTRRVWTLLKAEIEEEPGADSTKLIHLADEIVQARRSAGGAVDDEEEKRLRAAVDRTVRDTDPVYILLMKRLVNAMAERLLEPPTSNTPPSGANVYMQAGRDVHRSSGNMRLNQAQMDHGLQGGREKKAEKPLIVKGFEDEALVEAVTEVMSKVRVSVEWTEEVWSNMIKGGIE